PHRPYRSCRRRGRCDFVLRSRREGLSPRHRTVDPHDNSGNRPSHRQAAGAPGSAPCSQPQERPAPSPGQTPTAPPEGQPWAPQCPATAPPCGTRERRAKRVGKCYIPASLGRAAPQRWQSLGNRRRLDGERRIAGVRRYGHRGPSGRQLPGEARQRTRGTGLYCRQDAQVSHSNGSWRPCDRRNVALRPPARTHQFPSQGRRAFTGSAAEATELPRQTLKVGDEGRRRNLGGTQLSLEPGVPMPLSTLSRFVLGILIAVTLSAAYADDVSKDPPQNTAERRASGKGVLPPLPAASLTENAIATPPGQLTPTHTPRP